MPRILLIDDEDLVIRSLEKLLKKEGYEVVSARDGREALKQIEGQDFDLVVSDIRMPHLNGIETISEIRKLLKQGGRHPIPEVCITGYADDDLNKRADELGIAGYLYKPFDLKDFLNCVKSNLKKV